MIGGQPIFILKEGSKRETGKDAMKNNIDAAKSIASAVRSSLGPRGMDKMLVDSLGDIVMELPPTHSMRMPDMHKTCSHIIWQSACRTSNSTIPCSR